jgi:hypothetical protein
VATSIRVKIGLEAYQFERASGIHIGQGKVLRPRDGVRVLGRLRPGELRQLQPLATSAGRRAFSWRDDLRRVLTELVASGRVRVRKIEARRYRVIGTIPDEPELVAPEPVQNEIVDTHGVMIELIDAEGNPVPGEPFRIKLPDGSIITDTLDDEGKAHITGIEQPSTCQVCFYKRDAAIWAPG